MEASFPLLENYCSYMLAALGRAELTVKEYRYDLILFARFLKIDRGLVPEDTPLEEIDISDIDVKMLNTVTHRIFTQFLQVSALKKKSHRSQPCV